MNPFQVDEWLFAKWGQPKNLGIEDDGFKYRCERCGATWVGPNGDHCYWCHQRWIVKQADFKQALLVPEWLSWGERYSGAKPIDREVWANTRGYRGDFVTPWMLRLERALNDGAISDPEFSSALNRWAKWKTTIQQSEPLSKS